MKKILGLMLSLVLIICVFSACGDNSNKYITDNGENSQASSLNSTASGESKPDNSKGNASTGTNQTNNSSKNDKTELTENSSTEGKSETSSKIDISALYDLLQSQEPTSNVSKDFKPIVDINFSGGNGTQTNPYIITTAEQLVYFSEKINSGKMNNGVYFALGADIDMAEMEFSPIGNCTNRFSSNFNGRGFTVSNLTPKLIYEDFGNNANYCCGFFGVVGNAQIKNLCLENVNITYTYESNYFSEMGILAGCVYPTQECVITDCVVNGNINIDTDILLAGGIVGDIFVTDGAKLEIKRIQSNTKLQLRSNSLNTGAISGSLLVHGEEIFSDICVQSEILHDTKYTSYIGAFGGVANIKGSTSVSNCFIKINTNKKLDDEVHPLVGGIIDSYQPRGTFNFTNVFGYIDGCTKLYEIPSENPVKEENCGFTNVLPSNCNFNTEIWDITNPAAPFIKFNFER